MKKYQTVAVNPSTRGDRSVATCEEILAAAGGRQESNLSEEEIDRLLDVFYDKSLHGSIVHENAQKILIDVATNIIYTYAKNKVSPEDVEDYRSEAKLQAYESLVSYDRGQGSFINYVYSRNSWFGREANVEKMTQLTKVGGPQRRVLNAYKAASSQKYDTVTPADVLEQTIKYNMDKNPDLTYEECLAKIKKTGEYKLIHKDLNHIIQLSEVGFDLTVKNCESEFENSNVPSFDNIEDYVSKDPIEGAIEKILRIIGDKDDLKQAITAGYFGVLGKILGTYSVDNNEIDTVKLNSNLGYTDLTRISSKSKEEVKSIVKENSNKIKTPHAHWVYLTEGAEVKEEKNYSYENQVESIQTILQ